MGVHEAEQPRPRGFGASSEVLWEGKVRLQVEGHRGAALHRRQHGVKGIAWLRGGQGLARLEVGGDKQAQQFVATVGGHHPVRGQAVERRRGLPKPFGEGARVAA